MKSAHPKKPSVAFVANATKPGAREAKRSLAAAAKKLGLALAPAAEADVIAVLGGDGTMLRAAHEFPGRPLLGLNLGGLGYLASVSGKAFDKALKMLARGRYSVSERTMLEVSNAGKTAVALNEIAFRGGLSGHAAVLDVESDGRAVTRYLADGLLIATPTGSTAYSLAAGGPVLMPGVPALVLTPLNPHALAARPVVVGDEVRFTVTLRSRAGGDDAEPVGVYADGELVFEGMCDSPVEVKKSASSAKLVELDGYDPYDVMSRKLGWTGSSVQ
ncbi:MAG: NAD(+)/NADH kinase [Kiritimatiellae bacterium]|nr:NAD(+)/NADH kinase [Kiritimatiellia bacterium]